MTEETLFHLALQQPAAERASFLEKMCGADDTLRQRVAALLDAVDNPGDFLGPPPVKLGTTVDETPTEGPGSRIGPYKLLQQIGEGGMGTVFLAEQQEPVRRMVAVKVIKLGMNSRQVVARFEAERQALALMDHPNIAKVLDADTTVSGRPYFVMELVKGVPLTKYCDEHRLTPRERLELFLPICRAVQHAHQKGIIHRDLKPSNVLVTLYDGRPVPKVIDFGLAKATGSRLTDKTLFTGFGAVVGTLEYMSPEQAEVNQLDVDTRADVYALGVLLYELLTGTTPLTRQRLREAALLEILRLIREEEPPKPSTRLSTAEGAASIAANRGLEPKKLSGLVRGDLDWIVMKCLEKDRDRRYETANGLASDVQRYLADEPVSASPPSAWYRLRKFTRRHKAGLLATLTVLVVGLLAASGTGWVLWDRAARETAQRTERGRRVAETERAVSVALAKAEQWSKQAKQLPSATSAEAEAALAVWRQAEATVAEADAALSTGEAGEGLGERVAAVRLRIEQGRGQAEQRRTQTLRQEKLFRDLDDAYMAETIHIGVGRDQTGSAAEFAAAFTAYGLDVRRNQPEELTRRIRGEEPAVRDALILGLYEWSVKANEPSAAKLRALIVATDDDPWRRRFRTAAAAQDRQGLKTLSVEIRKASLAASSLRLLASGFQKVGQNAEAVEVLRWGRSRYPTDFRMHFGLAVFLCSKGNLSPSELEEVIGGFRAALALRPKASIVHGCLGDALKTKLAFDEAIVEYGKAIEFNPTWASPYYGLGAAHSAKKEWADAITAFRKSIDLRPTSVDAHNDLGIALRNNHQVDEAIAEYREVIRLAPNDVAVHINLAVALSDKKQMDAALREYRKVLKIDPNNVIAHRDLGKTLATKRQWDEAIAEYRKAIKLSPNNVGAHNGLGIALANTHQLGEAIAEFRKTIQIDPKFALGHNNLGSLLKDQQHLDEAITELRRAVEIDPTYVQARFNLGNALLLKGNFAEAKNSTLQALKLLPENHPQRPIFLRQLQQCESLLLLEAKLPDVLAGKAQPANNRERLGFIELSRFQRRYAAAARLSGDALAADPKLGDPRATYRYNAACFAALAAAGQGIDADKLDDKERTRLRRQALDWLRADLDLWGKLWDGGKAADRQLLKRTLSHWRKDTDLTTVRDPAALKKLPAAEQEAWRKLWADVGNLLKTAGDAK